MFNSLLRPLTRLPLPQLRPISSIPLTEMRSNGATSEVNLSLRDLTTYKSTLGLPLRHLRQFFDRGRAKVEVKGEVRADALPSTILSRPGAKAFVVCVQNVHVLCQKDSCLVMHSESVPVQMFLRHLNETLRHGFNSTSLSDPDALPLSNLTPTFETAVMESALATCVLRYHRHLNLLRPLLDLLLHETSSNPSAEMLRRMLAFRKSLNSFQFGVDNVRETIGDVLKDEPDLRGLCLSENVTKEDVEEIEFLLEAYSSELKEISLELKSMDEQIEDTNDFIKIHLNSLRNSMIRLSVFMEMGMLSVGVGALCAGVFGMNLTSGLESHPEAFYYVSGGILFLAGTIFGGVFRKMNSLSRDLSTAKSYQALRQFFSYVESVDSAFLKRNKAKNLDRDQFEKLLEPVLGSHLTDKEIDILFKVLDHNMDGKIDEKEMMGMNTRRRIG